MYTVTCYAIIVGSVVYPARYKCVVGLPHLAVSKDAPSFAFLRKKQHLLDKSSLAPSVTNISVLPASPCLPPPAKKKTFDAGYMSQSTPSAAKFLVNQLIMFLCVCFKTDTGRVDDDAVG